MVGGKRYSYTEYIETYVVASCRLEHTWKGCIKHVEIVSLAGNRECISVDLSAPSDVLPEIVALTLQTVPGDAVNVIECSGHHFIHRLNPDKVYKRVLLELA